MAQGRDVRQHAGGQGDPLRLRRGRTARARRAGRTRLPHRRAHLLPPRRARAAGPARGAARAGAHDRRPRDRVGRGVLHRAPARRSAPHRGQGAGGGRGGRARRAGGVRRARGRGGRRRPLPPLRPAPRARARPRATRRRCSVAVAAESELRLGLRPELEQVRELAARHNLVPVCQTFLEDCETPVSAFLKLRGAGPAFLLESAEQGQRVGRWSFIGYRPRHVVRWNLADGGDPYALAAAEVERHRQAPLPEPAAVRRRRGRLLRLRLRPHRRADRRAEPGHDRAARPRADAHRRARRVRPPQAHGDDPRQRLRGGGGRRGRLRARPRRHRRGARAAGRPAAAAGRQRRAGAGVRAEHAARGVRGDGRADRRVHPRRRRLPGRAVAALVGGDRRRRVLDLPRAARDQPVAVHVLPRLRGLPDRRRLARAARHRHRRPRHDAADRRARARAAATSSRTRRSRRTCSPTRRSAPST